MEQDGAADCNEEEEEDVADVSMIEEELDEHVDKQHIT